MNIERDLSIPINRNYLTGRDDQYDNQDGGVDHGRTRKYVDLKING